MQENNIEIVDIKFQTPIPNVKACFTTRRGGFSKAPYDGLNLAEHVNDDFATVEKNRELLRNSLEGKPVISWMNQTHSTDVAVLNSTDDALDITDADAQITSVKNVALAVMTADCLPILLVDDKGTKIACVHAGWRGLSGGIIAETVEAMDLPSDSINAWLGPCISQDNFEVGDLVRTEFVEQNPEYSIYFLPSGRFDNKYYASLQDVARFQLNKLGIKKITKDTSCTFNDKERFYSYRRDYITGRFASLIWIE